MGRRAVVMGVALALAATALAVVALGRGEDTEGPGPLAARFLAAWEAGDFDGLAAMTVAETEAAQAAEAQGVAEAHRQMDEALQIEDRDIRAGEVSERDGSTVVPFTAEQTVAGLGQWAYEGALPLVEVEGGWRVRWTPAVLHPESHAGAKFSLQRTWPERAPIVGAGGEPLVAQSDVVTVGVQPDRIDDRAVVAAALERHLGVAPESFDRALAQPWVQPEHFVPIADVRPDRFDEVEPELEPVPGVFFRRTTGRLAPTEEFAAHTIGAVGDVTAERLEQLGAPYRAGDVVGMSGLEAAFEDQLAGRPTAEILVTGDDGVVATLHTFEGVAPEPVRTTLDARVQRAADAALATVGAPAAVVAVDVSTGAIRAVSSRPLSEPFNRALSGRYPPGSTFKVVTTAALLAGGTTPHDPVDCPPEVVVGGKRFRNFEGEALGTTSFRQAFVHSCNTAFVQLAAEVGEEEVARAARTFGFGEEGDPDLPIGAIGGRFPAVGDTAELAAASIGQARVTASPLHLATVAAAVGSGGWRPARLLADATAAESEAAMPLVPGVAGTLQELMRGVVAEGTGTAAAAPGPPVLGKTGTAEFGEGDPLPTHALFIGVRGDIAVAVVVEGGGVGGRVAAPVAARFFAAL